MPYRTAKLLPVVLIGALAATTLMLVPSPPAQAEECLAAPKAATPAGSHWRYRVERATKRHCWYLADKRTTPAASAAVPASAPAAANNLADARAELVTEPTPPDPAAASVWPAPERSAPPPAETAPDASAPDATANPGWSLASRWADTGAPADTPTAAAPLASSADTAISPTAPWVADAAAAPSPFGSQAMLIAGLAAALGLAGLIVRLVVRLASARPIVRREPGLRTRPIFDVEIPDMPPPPWLASPAPSRTTEPAVSHSDAEPPPLNWVRVARARSQADLASDAIEELLAKVSPRPSLGARHQG
jgi:hypothetical protein